MDTLEKYRKIIQKILNQYAQIPYAYEEITSEVIFDQGNDRYLLMAIGWDGVKRIHGCVIHLDIIDGKVWIQRDGTEEGVADELVAEGIPKNHIVLGFRSEEVRKYTEYAIV